MPRRLHAELNIARKRRQNVEADIGEPTLVAIEAEEDEETPAGSDLPPVYS
jgi:hypothetical protein